MLLTDLVRLYPELFHMADEHSWPSIQRHGLLPTNALLDRWEVETPGTEALLSRLRAGSVVIEHDTYGSAVIRDQKPLNHEALASALVDLSVEEWLEELNSRSFMFLQRERLFTLLNARSYRDRCPPGHHHRYRQLGPWLRRPHRALPDQLRVCAAPQQGGTGAGHFSANLALRAPYSRCCARP
jgi:hypothetical protein